MRLHPVFLSASVGAPATLTQFYQKTFLHFYDFFSPCYLVASGRPPTVFFSFVFIHYHILKPYPLTWYDVDNHFYSTIIPTSAGSSSRLIFLWNKKAFQLKTNCPFFSKSRTGVVPVWSGSTGQVWTYPRWGHGWDWAWGACMVSGGRLGWAGRVGACRGVPVLREDGAMARLEGSPRERVWTDSGTGHMGIPPPVNRQKDWQTDTSESITFQ